MADQALVSLARLTQGLGIHRADLNAVLDDHLRGLFRINETSSVNSARSEIERQLRCFISQLSDETSMLVIRARFNIDLPEVEDRALGRRIAWLNSAKGIKVKTATERWKPEDKSKRGLLHELELALRAGLLVVEGSTGLDMRPDTGTDAQSPPSTRFVAPASSDMPEDERNTRSIMAPSSRRQLADSSAAILVNAVQARCQEADRHHRVNDGFLLPMRWSNAPDHLVDHWETIRREPGNNEPIDLADALPNIRSLLDRIPSGRLVVLGGSGEGKTVFATQLTHSLLEAARLKPNAPIPLLCEIGTWDASHESFRAWLRAQIVILCPQLATTTELGVSAADELLRSGRLIPILDGFDELSPGRRTDTLKALNHSLATTDRLVLTSRPEEYEEAAKESRPLVGAAAIQLENFSLENVNAYLRRGTAKVVGGDGGQRVSTKWDAVLAELQSKPQDPAAQRLLAVLAFPRGLAMIRTVYCDTPADPKVLLSAEGFPTEASIAAHLFDSFIEATWPMPLDTHRRRRRYSAEDAKRWLRFIAFCNDANCGNFEWWHLPQAVSRVRILFGGWLAGICCAGTVLVAANQAAIPMVSTVLGRLAYALYLAMVALVLFPLFFGFRRWRFASEPPPSRIKVHLGSLRPLRLIRGTIGQAFSAQPVVYEMGGAMAVGFAFVSSAYAPYLVGGSISLAMGAAAFAILLLVRYLGTNMSTPMDVNRVTSPVMLLRASRNVTILRSTLATSLTGVALSFIYASSHHSQTRAGLAWPISCAMLLVLWCSLDSVWGRWLQARVFLAAQGSLPWSLVTFLEEARARGLLRTQGGVYRFLDDLLESHLSESYAATLSRSQSRREWALRGRLMTALWQAYRGAFDDAEAELRTICKTTWLKPWSREARGIRLLTRFFQTMVRYERGGWDDIGEAEAEFRALSKQARRLFGETAPPTLECQAWLADVLVEGRQLVEAAAELERIREAIPKLDDDAKKLVEHARLASIEGRLVAMTRIKAWAASVKNGSEPDWMRLLGYYDELRNSGCSVHDGLIRAKIANRVLGPEGALSRVEEVEQVPNLEGQKKLGVLKLKGYLLERLNRLPEAAMAYESALSAAIDEVDRTYLVSRLSALRGTPTAAVPRPHSPPRTEC